MEKKNIKIQRDALVNPSDWAKTLIEKLMKSKSQKETYKIKKKNKVKKSAAMRYINCKIEWKWKIKWKEKKNESKSSIEDTINNEWSSLKWLKNT